MSESRAEPSRRRAFVMQVLKFCAVGGVGVVLNLIVFNVLLATVFSAKNVHHGPLYATVVATVVAIAANWVGNRFWAFSAQRQKNTLREGIEFFLVSLAALGIPLLCVWVSHYVLGFTSVLADNIANNVVGLALGTLFRFALYKFWVYAPERTRISTSETLADVSNGLPDVSGGLPRAGGAD
jgi:putative flippase GtrA